MASEIGKAAMIPNPVLKRLNGLIGDWQTRGIHPAFPDTILHGRASFAWQDGGAFLVWRSEISHPQFPSGIAIFGSDDAAQAVFIAYFDERGVSRKYDVTIESEGFTMRRIDPKVSQRATFKIQAGGNRVVSRGEISLNGGAWESDLSLNYERLR